MVRNFSRTSKAGTPEEGASRENASVDNDPAQSRNSDIRWNYTVVGLLCGVSGLGRRSRATTLAREELERQLREDKRYKVISKSDLSAKGKDPKAVANSLRNIIKQDAARGVNLKKKISNELPKMFSIRFDRNAKEEDSDSSDDNEQNPQQSIESLKSNGTQGASTQPSSSGLSPENSEENNSSTMVQFNIETEEDYLVSQDIGIGPETVVNPEDFLAAKSALTLDPALGDSDCTFVLLDYPENEEELGALMNSSPTESLIDAIVELKDDMSSGEEGLTIPNQSMDTNVSSEDVELFDEREEESESNTDSKPGARFAAQSQAKIRTMNKSTSRLALRNTSSAPSLEGKIVRPEDVVGRLKLASRQMTGTDRKGLLFLTLDIFGQSGPPAQLPKNDGSVWNPLVAEWNSTCRHLGVEKYRFTQYLATCRTIKVPSAGPGVEAQPLQDRYLEQVAEVPEELLSVVIVLDAMVRAVAICGGQTRDLDGDACSEERRVPPQVQLVHARDRSLRRVQAAALRRVANAGGDAEARSSLQLSPVEARVLAIERALHRLVRFPGGRGRSGMPVTPLWSREQRRVRASQLRTFAKLPEWSIDHVNHVMHLEQLVHGRDPSSRNHWRFRRRRFCERLSAEVVAQEAVALLGEEKDLLYEYHQETDSVVLAAHQHVPQGRRYCVPRGPLLHTRVRPTLGDWPQLNLATRPVVYDVDVSALRELEGQTEFLFPCDDSIVRVEQRKAGAAWVSVLKDGHLFGLRGPESGGGRSGRFRANFVASFEDDTRAVVEQGPPSLGKPDGCGTVTVGYTCTNGLLVRVCSDGSIWQALCTRAEKGHVPVAHAESSRTVVGLGTVVRQLRDGRVQLLFANGAVAESLERAKPAAAATLPSAPVSGKAKRSTGARAGLLPEETAPESAAPVENLLEHKGHAVKRWRVTCFTQDDGALQYEQAGAPEVLSASVRSFKIRSSKNLLKVSGLRRVETEISIDPETNSVRVVRASDGVCLERDPRGVLEARHVDGTVITTRGVEAPGAGEEAAGEEQITVAAPGLCSVMIRCGTETNARCHASGGRVEISSGGRKTRSSTTTPDGAVIRVDYDTRITATVNGFVNLTKEDGTQIDAQDDGLVLYGPSSTLAGSLQDSAGSQDGAESDGADNLQDRAVTGNLQDRAVNGLFRFDCEAGSLEAVDSENNIFQVRGAVSARQQVSELNLSGAVQNLCPVVNRPMQPRLLVLPGDGTAEELLTDASVEAFLRLARNKPGYQYRRSQHVHTPAFQLPSDPATSFHHFLHRLAAAQGEQCTLVVERSLVERAPVSEGVLAHLQAAYDRFNEWTAHVESAEDRYAVLDTRSAAELRNEVAVQRKIMKERRRLRKLEAKRQRRGSKGTAGARPEPAIEEVERRHSLRKSVSSRPAEQSFRHGVESQCGDGSGKGVALSSEASPRLEEHASAEDYWKVAYPLHPNCATANYWRHRERVAGGEGLGGSFRADKGEEGAAGPAGFGADAQGKGVGSEKDPHLDGERALARGDSEPQVAAGEDEVSSRPRHASLAA